MKDNKIFNDKIFERNLSIQQRKELLKKGLDDLYDYINNESDKFNIHQQHYLLKYSYGTLQNSFIMIERKILSQKRLSEDFADLRRKHIANNSSS